MVEKNVKCAYVHGKVYTYIPVVQNISYHLFNIALKKKVCNPELWIEAPCMYTTAAMNHSWNEEKSGKSARLFNDRCCLHSKITSSQLRSTCRRVTAEHSQSKLVTTISTSMYVSVWCQSSCPKKNSSRLQVLKNVLIKSCQLIEGKNGHFI